MNGKNDNQTGKENMQPANQTQVPDQYVTPMYHVQLPGGFVATGPSTYPPDEFITGSTYR